QECPGRTLPGAPSRLITGSKPDKWALALDPMPTNISAIVVAAGRGERAGDGPPKPYRTLAGRSVLARTLASLLGHPDVARTVVVIHRDHESLYSEAVATLAPEMVARLLPPVVGGDSRQASVRAGVQALDALALDGHLVLVHDAARPFLTTSLIDRAVATGM